MNSLIQSNETFVRDVSRNKRNDTVIFLSNRITMMSLFSRFSWKIVASLDVLPQRNTLFRVSRQNQRFWDEAGPRCVSAKLLRVSFKKRWMETYVHPSWFSKRANEMNLIRKKKHAPRKIHVTCYAKLDDCPFLTRKLTSFEESFEKISTMNLDTEFPSRITNSLHVRFCGESFPRGESNFGHLFSRKISIPFVVSSSSIISSMLI